MVAALAVVTWPVILVVIGWLWRSRRIADRVAVLCTLSSVPALFLFVLLAQGVNVVFVLFVEGVVVAVTALMYRPSIGLIAGASEASLAASDPVAGLSRRARIAIIVVAAVPQLLLVAVFVMVAVTHRI